MTILFLRGEPTIRLIGLALSVLFASAAVGALGGFLFGVPKSVPRQNGEGEAQPYEPNSNLEQVSDWLTKIIVGVGLVEIRHLGSGLWSLAERLGGAFGDDAGQPGAGAIFGLALVLGGVLTSFVITYMWVRTRLFEVLAKLSKSAG